MRDSVPRRLASTLRPSGMGVWITGLPMTSRRPDNSPTAPRAHGASLALRVKSDGTSESPSLLNNTRPSSSRCRIVRSRSVPTSVWPLSLTSMTKTGPRWPGSPSAEPSKRLTISLSRGGGLLHHLTSQELAGFREGYKGEVTGTVTIHDVKSFGVAGRRTRTNPLSGSWMGSIGLNGGFKWRWHAGPGCNNQSPDTR